MFNHMINITGIIYLTLIGIDALIRYKRRKFILRKYIMLLIAGLVILLYIKTIPIYPHPSEEYREFSNFLDERQRLLEQTFKNTGSNAIFAESKQADP